VVQIPDYALYGEPQDRQLTDRLHIETVPYRSAAHGWKIRPHRHHGLCELFWIDAGGGQLEIEGSTRVLCPPLAILMPPMIVHGFEFAPGTDGFVVSLPIATVERVLSASLQDHLDRTLLLPQRGATPAAAINPRALFADVLGEYSRNLPGRSEALDAYAALLATWFLRAGGSASRVGRPGVRTVLLRRFMAAIERRFHEQPSVSRLAKELGVSTPHLTRACRELLGQPALSLVHERIIFEAKRHLGFTSMPVSQVAYTLGFADPAYFSRFFRDRVGVSPSVYRATLAEAAGSSLEPAVAFPTTRWWLETRNQPR
jgi:AraC family transcriptional activator of pobA